MGNKTSLITLLLAVTISSYILSSYGYDQLDPYGNVTITWDFIQDNTNAYDIKVSIWNLQQYRHVELPGWNLEWTWNGTSEVIWDMRGAETKEQGDCSKFKGGPLPHCCVRRPSVVDYLPGTPYNKQFANCCRGGVLSSMVQDPSLSLSSFQMSVGGFTTVNHNGEFDDYGDPVELNPYDKLNLSMPFDFSLGVPGYTCGPPTPVLQTRFPVDNGRRWTQAIETWNITCTYSQFQASRAPKCCIAFSAFYSTEIVNCPRCSCGCQGLGGAKCVKSGDKPPPDVLKLPKGLENPATATPDLVTCSQHMCPIKIHWHVKQSYKEYWRVKMTITNFNFVRNYSDWNLVVHHPNLKSVTQLFSFNYKSLNTYGNINDTGMFWGIKYFNDMILTSGKQGNAQTEILLHKDEGFTFSEGWAFPRRILFNGDECVMPLPDDYPRLPNRAISSSSLKPSLIFFCFLFLAPILF